MMISRLFWIGLIFVLSIVAFVSGLLFIQDISIKKSNYTFTVLFENVQGLHVGDQVESDICGAEKVGITPVLLDRDGNHRGFSRCKRIENLSDLAGVLCQD